jgi:hypothetical protein
MERGSYHIIILKRLREILISQRFMRFCNYLTDKNNPSFPFELILC